VLTCSALFTSGTGPTDSPLGVFQQRTDPRDPRGVRHPFAGLLALAFLGLLSRQPDFASIARWAKRHGTVLKPGAPEEPLKARADALNWDVQRPVKLLTG
jgi:hypothetical protein